MRTKFPVVTVFALLSFASLAHARPATGQASQSPDPTAMGSASPAASPSIPPGQIPSKEQLAKLFEVMRLRDQMQGLMNTIPAMVKAQVQSQMGDIMAKLAPGAQLTDDQQAQLAALITKYVDKATNVYTIDTMISDMTTVYQHHLSKADVDAMIAFYASPAGQHLLNAQPAIMKEYTPIVMQRQRQATDQLTEEMQKDLEAFTKSITPPSPVPAPK
jgi:hypothetical protein